MTFMVVDGKKRLYEILVLYDPADATKDWDGLVNELTERVTKLDGNILKIDQWAENKKLAYEVKGLRRGTYLCGYFHLDPSQVAPLERNLHLDERVVRHIVLQHNLVPNGLSGEPEEEHPDSKDNDSRDSRDSRRK